CDLLVRSQTLYPTELRARFEAERNHDFITAGSSAPSTTTLSRATARQPTRATMHETPVSHLEHQQRAPRSVRCAVITISDTRTLDTDTAGAAITDMLRAAGHEVVGRTIVRDDADMVRGAIGRQLADPGVQAIITTGGTGITSRDNTYEAVAAMLDKRLDGFGELFRMLSYEQVGAAAMLSRACAGLISGRFVAALPGSEAAVRLAMDRLLIPELGHLVGEAAR
ncbi:MAG: molybdenum cofactor biosynthesis protein B, partial [Acidobacteriota bacterium]